MFWLLKKLLEWYYAPPSKEYLKSLCDEAVRDNNRKREKNIRVSNNFFQKVTVYAGLPG